MTSDDSLTQKTLLLFHRNEGLCFQQMAVISHLHVNWKIKRSFLPWTRYQQKGVVQVMEQNKPCDWRSVLSFLCACIHWVVGNTEHCDFFWQAVLWITSLEDDAALFGSASLRGDVRHRTGEVYWGSKWGDHDLYTLCKFIMIICSSTEGRRTQFVQSGSETSPRKVCLINAFSFPTDRCGEVCGKLCCSVTQLELPGQQEHSCRGQQVKRMLFV